MAKRKPYNENQQQKKKQTTKKEMQLAVIEDTVLLRSGIKIICAAFPRERAEEVVAEAEHEFDNSENYVEQPWYYSVEPSGPDANDGEKIYWTERDLEKDGSPEEKKEWEKYQRSLLAKELFVESQVLYAIFTESILGVIDTKNNEHSLIIDPITFEIKLPDLWIKHQTEKLHRTLPDDPFDLKFMFVRSIIPDAQSRKIVSERCSLLALSGFLTEEGLARVESSFRFEMEKASSGFAERLAKLTQDTGGESTDAKQADLDVQSKTKKEPSS